MSTKSPKKQINKSNRSNKAKVSAAPRHHRTLTSAIIILSATVLGFAGGLLVGDFRYDLKPAEDLSMVQGAQSEYTVTVYGDGQTNALDLLRDKYDISTKTIDGTSIVERIGNISTLEGDNYMSWNLVVNNESIQDDPSQYIPSVNATVEWILGYKNGD